MSNKKTTKTNLPTPEKPTDAIPQQPYISPNYGSQYHMGGSSFPMVEDSVEKHEIADEYLTDGYLTEKEQQQLLLDEEALRETLEEEARAEKELSHISGSWDVFPYLVLPPISLSLQPRTYNLALCIFKNLWRSSPRELLRGVEGPREELGGVKDPGEELTRGTLENFIRLHLDKPTAGEHGGGCEDKNCRQPLGYAGNVHKTFHGLAKGKDCLVLLAKVAGSLKEDLGEMLEVEVAMVEEEVGGVENKSLVGSKFMASGEECLDGWVGAGGGEVKGDGVVFGVSKILLGEIPEDIMGESGGEAFGVDGGAD
ncbi:hypothetical protein Tco_0844371 [Tanacetum coccineum]